MNSYDRIFGTGPRGLLISLILLALTRWLKNRLGTPTIINNRPIRFGLFGLFTLITAAIALWSVKSLPPEERGRHLVTTGAFHHFRHPLYGAFLSCFNFGLAILLNNWLYVAWAIAQHPVWHWNIQHEEAMVREIFPDYEAYAAQTGRFFPKLK